MQPHDNDAVLRRQALLNTLGWLQVCMAEDERQGGTKQAEWKRKILKVELEIEKEQTHEL